LKVTTETFGPRELELTVEPDPKRIEQAMRKAARDITHFQPVPGFRPGRAPYELVLRRIGEDIILNEALQAIGRDLYDEAIREAGVEPFERTQLGVESEKPLILKLRVPLKPVVILGDYKALTIEPEAEPSISDEQIDEQIETLRRRHAEYEPVERPIEMGDQITASIIGTTNETESVIDQEDATLDVSEDMVPAGFSEALVGMAPGEAREFSLTYPEDFDNTDLASKTVRFEVEIKTVRQVNLPEVNDDLAKMVGDFETMDELRERIASNLLEQARQESRNRERENALNALIEVAKVEYPEAALKREVDSAINQQRMRLQQMGFEWGAYLRMIGKRESEIREELTPTAERNLVQRLVLAEYAQAEGIEATEEELAAEMAEIEQDVQATYGDRAEEAMQGFRSEAARNSIREQILIRKAMEHLTAALTGREETEEASETEDDAEAEAESDES
jgi:trigger factor